MEQNEAREGELFDQAFAELSEAEGSLPTVEQRTLGDACCQDYLVYLYGLCERDGQSG